MIPAGVKVAVNPASRTVNFEGPKGKLSMTYRPEVGVKLEGANVEVTMDPAIVELGSNRAFWGTTRALIATAVEGVLKGYEKKLEIVGVGWGAKVQGKKLVLTVGFANTLDVAIPDGVKVEVVQMMITVS
jgi:large subunit ribosomal protein L6